MSTDFEAVVAPNLWYHGSTEIGVGWLCDNEFHMDLITLQRLVATARFLDLRQLQYSHTTNNGQTGFYLDLLRSPRDTKFPSTIVKRDFILWFFDTIVAEIGRTFQRIDF